MLGNKGKGKRKVIRKRDPSEDSDPEPKVILKFIGFIVLSCQKCHTRSRLNNASLLNCYP